MYKVTIFAYKQNKKNMNLLELTKARYSVRSYLPIKPEKEKLEYIMECVRMAPSAVNLQPWRFRIISDEKELNELCECYKREWIKSAPCIIVACVDHEESWHRREDDKDHGDIDVAIAIEHLCLAATEQGLGTCWVCNFNVVSCRDFLKLPYHIEPVALIPIGYSQGEQSEKKRKTIDEIMI